MQTSSLDVDVGHIDVTFADEPFPFTRDRLTEWIRTAARAVSAYYGHFPVRHVSIRVNGFDGYGVHSGTTDSNRAGAYIDISVGRSTSEQQLIDDWMMTHEMVHLAFPSVDREHHWIEEGLATYVEPWARVRIGNLTPKKVWGDLVRDMPKGNPEPGDRGLDRTHTWARTYWGGALFCFVADVDIRKQTKNQKGLEDALRAINRDGGSVNTDWDLEDALRAGDKATGTNVLENLYREMKNKPVNVDLPALWRELGVKSSGGEIVLDDAAPLAAIRRSIERTNS